MKKLFAITITLAALALAACGSGDPAELAQANGTPKAAVVYVGSAPFPELASVPDAWVYTNTGDSLSSLAATMERARRDSGKPRVYMIGSHAGAGLAMQYLAGNAGGVDIVSLWFTPPPAATVVGPRLSTVYLNAPAGDTVCRSVAEQLRAALVPSLCVDSGPEFGATERARAIAQLRLDLVR